MLEELAQQDGQSKTATVAALVREEWERREARAFTRASLDDISRRRSNLLDRLSK